MAKKRSFADKAARAQQKPAFSNVKYVKATLSQKTGHYRFQETMLKVPTGMSLDAYLAEMDKGKGRKAEGPAKDTVEDKAEVKAEGEGEVKNTVEDKAEVKVEGEDEQRGEAQKEKDSAPGP